MPTLNASPFVPRNTGTLAWENRRTSFGVGDTMKSVPPIPRSNRASPPATSSENTGLGKPIPTFPLGRHTFVPSVDHRLSPADEALSAKLAVSARWDQKA